MKLIEKLKIKKISKSLNIPKLDKFILNLNFHHFQNLSSSNPNIKYILKTSNLKT